MKAIIKETSSHYHVLDIDGDECYIEDIIEQANLIKNQYGSDVYELVQLYSKLNEAGKNKIMEELRDTAALPKYTEPVKRDAQKMA